MKKAIAALALSALPLVSYGFQDGQIYAGGGISNNSVSGFSEDGTGFQIFGGYGLGYSFGGNTTTAVEVGYMNSGDFGSADNSAQGLWSTGVLALPIEKVEFLLRAGFDFGDDDGLMVGAGVDYPLNDQFNIRVEFVNRDNINSFQFNFAYQL